MIRTALLAGVAFLIAGLGTGLYLSRDGAPQSQVAAIPRQRAPTVAKPGAEAAAAAAKLLEINPPPVSALAAALAPDVALTFRQDLAAVMGSGRNLYLLMKTNGVGSAHPLRIGQVYQDGWRLARLTNGEATLAKGDESRTVLLYAAAPSPDEQAATPLAAANITTATFGAFSTGATGQGGPGGGRPGAAGGQGGFTANINTRGGAAGAFGGAFGGGAFGGGAFGGRGGFGGAGGGARAVGARGGGAGRGG